MVVAVPRDNLDDAFLDPNNRYVECSAAEIVRELCMILSSHTSPDLRPMT
jgi:hypothetical protein